MAHKLCGLDRLRKHDWVYRTDRWSRAASDPARPAFEQDSLAPSWKAFARLENHRFIR
ncbi:MAG: hypothetical protein QM531_00600 [Candidatus Pacebacteria bacterium]|nr:hypothetical protein [Candidatus Paceibacterota bacterium]